MASNYCYDCEETLTEADKLEWACQHCHELLCVNCWPEHEQECEDNDDNDDENPMHELDDDGEEDYGSRDGGEA